MTIDLRVADSRIALPQLPSGIVDLTITSPPYKDEDGYSDQLIFDVSLQLYRLHRSNTLFFMNFGHLADDKARPFRAAMLAQSAGWHWSETFTWVKNHYKPIQGKRRVNNLTEFVFMFYKGKMPLLDRLAVGVPYADKSNIGRYSDQDLRCGGNVWYIPYETITSKRKKTHNDRFPLGLPRNCINICGYEVNVILDPFLGHGTTAIAAQEAGINFIGYDLCAENVETAKQKVEDEAYVYREADSKTSPLV